MCALRRSAQPFARAKLTKTALRLREAQEPKSFAADTVMSGFGTDFSAGHPPEASGATGYGKRSSSLLPILMVIKSKDVTRLVSWALSIAQAEQ